MREKDPPPEHLRCKRSDGRKWRCKRRAMDGKTMCEIHYLQGKRHQHKKKVPGSLKIERKLIKKKVKSSGESSSRFPKMSKTPVVEAETRRISEALDEALKRMKWEKGDLHLELIRVFLQRQVEKKKEKELKENAIGDETKELRYGIMVISGTPSCFQNFRENDVLDVKVGVDTHSNSFLQRHFRSKNIEPLPIAPVQIIPYAKNVKKKKIKKCHWCRENNCRCLIRCLSCRKRYFCVECIKERSFEKQEVKMKCPACWGTCTCKLCTKQQFKANINKQFYKGARKLNRIELLHYLVYMLLPVLKQINCDQSIELEIEAKITGKEKSNIQIPQTKLALFTLRCCNRCKTSIVDYHRTCANCSYNLCLSCCREISRNSSYGSFKLRRCEKRKIYSSGDELPFKQTISLSHGSLGNWETNTDGSIPCPPTSIGGCGESLLDLRCIYPFTWLRDLETRAQETLCSYKFPETADDSMCLLCNRIDSIDGEVKPHRELCRRAGYDDNYLYCPTVKDLHQDSIAHFQSHWGKGHPVIVRNVLQTTSDSRWDPVNMLCSYMESKSSDSESCNEDGVKATDCSDWCEVEIDRKGIFMGSLEKRTHASMQQKVLKFKAWISVHLFQKQFPNHYDEILNALPLPEYINPVSGLLNLGVKLSKELPMPDLGPCVYFSYGGPEELMQADFLSKLCYESHDTVNILAYATDVPASAEQICKIENLMKKHKARDSNHGQSFSNSSDQKGKSSLQSEDTGESGLHDVAEKMNVSNEIGNGPFDSSDTRKAQTTSVVNGNLSDDGESDAEASILCCGSIEYSENSNEIFEEDIESSCSSEDKQKNNSCGAQWDIFRRQDVPKLIEYLKKYSNELSSACSYSKHVHPILDQNFFLDAYHKLRLKREFDIQPWTFEQCPGEAIFIPAGCPYQIRKIKSCINVVLDFISPESATQCIQLTDEIRLLPVCHKAMLEVKKMAVHGISSAIEDLNNLTDVQQG